MGKVVEFHEEERKSFSFFTPLSEEQVKLAERLIKALSEGEDNADANGAG